MSSILVLNGPNLNLLGTREPERYGLDTLDTIRVQLEQLTQRADHQLAFMQSNAEHELVERIHQAQAEKTAYIIINPAAFTHTGVALRDALLGTGIPFIEVHLSNLYAREKFRQHSYFSDIAQGVICGFGAQSYVLALRFVLNSLSDVAKDNT